MGRIFITGDCHGEITKFSKKNFPIQAELTKEDVVIILGDFGLIWDQQESSYEKYWLDWLNQKPFTTLFIDGNHENFDRLFSDEYPEDTRYGGKVKVIRDSILYLKRGEVFTINGKKFFAFGGARSHDISAGILDLDDPNFEQKYKELRRTDAPFRVNHISWWEQEMPHDDDFANGLAQLEKHDFEVDYVLTHTLPYVVLSFLFPRSAEMDALSSWFNTLIKVLGPFEWFCGHYHMDKQDLFNFTLLYDTIIEIT